MKMFVISGLLVAAYFLSHFLATAQRGYTAFGGELVFLMAIPVTLSAICERDE